MNCLANAKGGKAPRVKSKDTFLSSPLLVPTANKFSSGSWAIAEGFGGNPCSTACKKLSVLTTKHMCLDRYSIQKKRTRKAPKPNLVEEKTNPGRACPSDDPSSYPVSLKKTWTLLKRPPCERTEMRRLLGTNNLSRRSTESNTERLVWIKCKPHAFAKLQLGHGTRCQSNTIEPIRVVSVIEKRAEKNSSAAVVGFVNFTNKTFFHSE